MISKGEVKGQLARFAESCSQLNRQCKSTDIIDIVENICNTNNATGSDLGDAIMHILASADRITGTSLVPNLITEAFQSMGELQGHRGVRFETCKVPPRYHSNGRMLLSLSDLSVVAIPCHMCAQGKAIQPDLEFEQFQREIHWPEKFAEHQKMIKEAYKQFMEDLPGIIGERDACIERDKVRAAKGERFDASELFRDIGILINGSAHVDKA